MTLAFDPIRDAAFSEPGLDEALFALAARVPFARGEAIFTQGESADLIYQLVSGTVGLSRFTPQEGHDRLGGLSVPGALFGLDAGAQHDFTAEAVTDCLVLVASRRALGLLVGEAEVEALLDGAPPRPN